MSGAGLRLLHFFFLKRIIARAVSVSVTAIQFSMYIPPSIAIQRKAGTPQEVSLPFRIGCLANATRAICR